MSNPQQIVDRYFDQAAGYWREVYGDGGLQGLVYRERMEAALRWIDALELPPGTAVLDAGCGAGLMSIALAQRGFQLTATDSSAEMVALARAAAEEAGVPERIEVRIADAHRLPFAEESFGLVVALGLLPWLHDPQAAVRDLARVLERNGTMIVTADNRLRLNFIVEPRENPLLVPVKLARRPLKRRTNSGAPSHLHRPAEVDGFLRAAGVTPVRRATVGYGPFTFLGRPLISDTDGLRVHARLTSLSEARLRALRRMGWHYLVAARK